MSQGSKQKNSYEHNRNIADKLLDSYKNFIDVQATKLNLQQINQLDYERAIIAYEDQLCYHEFAAWEYEVKQALRDFKKTRKDFTNFDKAGIIIEEISSTGPKKKVNYKKSELTSKVFRVATESDYKVLVVIIKQMPVHHSDKRKFPLEVSETKIY